MNEQELKEFQAALDVLERLWNSQLEEDSWIETGIKAAREWLERQEKSA